MHRIYLKTVDYNDVISYTNKEHHPPRDRERESRTLSRLVVSLSLLKVRAPRYEFHIWVKDGPKQNGGFFSVANIQTYTQDLDLLCVLALIPTSCFNCIRAVVIIIFSLSHLFHFVSIEQNPFCGSFVFAQISFWFC